MGFGIYAVTAGTGQLALSPLPGGGGDFASDFSVLREWAPGLVISMTEGAEMAALGGGGLGAALAAEGIGWAHLPLPDFGAPGAGTLEAWPDVSARARALLEAGGRVLVHCRGGCGRSGMVVLRLLVELGEAPEAALARLREVRPCAVETEAQMAWAQHFTDVKG